MGDNGRGHKIPEEKWQEVYQLYASGTPVAAIRKKINEEWNIDVTERPIYTIIKVVREEKQRHLNDLLNAQANDDVGRLNWLQNRLEELAVESSFNDKPFFLKVADRLIKIHQLKLLVRAQNVPSIFNQNIDDNGRAKLIEELQKLS